MRHFFLASLTLVAGIAYVGVFHAADETPASQEPAASTNTPTEADANRLLQGQPGFFVPNLGQWDHAARFVHRSGPMSLFLEDRGWVIDLVERPDKPKPRPHVAVHQAMPGDRDVDQKIRGVALKMTFEGDAHLPEIVGEKKLPGHHNYFLGNDESRWRTGVPLYSSVRYGNLYPGIDLRLREANGVPEYDLLLEPGADLSQVTVHIEGGQGLSLASDGSLLIATALGPMTQSVPKSWQVDHAGRKQEVVCRFRLLAADRFGFHAPGWHGDTRLTIDPGLIWSTFLGGSPSERSVAVSVDASGVVWVMGIAAGGFPTTLGAYDTTTNGGSDIFVSRLDPSKTGTAQLVYSTFLGGSSFEEPVALSVDQSGVVTMTGQTRSSDFPTTLGAYDTTHNGPVGYRDVFVSRLDARKTGAAQLTYSTYLGGSTLELAGGLHVDDSGLAWVGGYTYSGDFPTTKGAFDTISKSQNQHYAFISGLDPRKTGSAQLVYSTYLGGANRDTVRAISVDAKGVVTVAGDTDSGDFPTTKGAYATTKNRPRDSHDFDAFVSRLDPSKTGKAQLVYSTYLGGGRGRIYSDGANALSVDASGVMTVVGWTTSIDFPTTVGAFDTTLNGDSDGFVSRLDPSKTGAAQLVYSTFLGGSSSEPAMSLSVDAEGVVTVAGHTSSGDFPTTVGAHLTTHSGNGDGFVSRLDPSGTGGAQLVYSTYLATKVVGTISFVSLSVDPSGVVTVSGGTPSRSYPVTSGAYSTIHSGGSDAFVSRLDMGVALYGDRHEISIKLGGTQKLTVNAGKPHANRLYWIFGSITGTNPGVSLLGVHIPLNPDLYTDFTIGNTNSSVLKNFRGTLDANGLAAASLNIPAKLPFPPGFTFHHAYVVYDASGIFMASNAVPLRLR